MTEAEKKVKDWCESKTGCGYIYGATGWICTQERLEQQAKQYPEYADTILNVGKKWIGKECYDCAQLTRNAAKQGGVTLVSGATSQWNKTNWQEKGKIESLPADRVCFLYRQDGNVMQHTGVYQGDGTVIDARGTKNGVLHTELGSYAWTHWAIPDWAISSSEDGEKSKEEVIMKAKVVATSGSTVNMRSSASSSASIAAKVPVGAEVDVHECGDEWWKIEYNGKSGYMMKKFLSEIDEEGEEEAGDGECELGEEDLTKIYKLLDEIRDILDTNTNAEG